MARPASTLALVALALGIAACSAGHLSSGATPASMAEGQGAVADGNNGGVLLPPAPSGPGAGAPRTDGKHLALQASPNKCIAAGPDGHSVGLYACDGVATQLWTHKGAQLVHSSGQCLARVGRTAADGAQVMLSACAPTDEAQMWQVGSNTVGQGTRCMDVKDGRATEGTPLQLWTCNNQDHQHMALAPPSLPGRDAAQAFVTTPSLSLALSAVPVLTGTAASAARASATLTLIPATTYQSITGFGASLTDSSSKLLGDGLTEAGKKAAMVRLFDPNAGIGISMLRQPMGASDFSAAGNFSYAETPGDTSFAQFSIAQDEKATLPLLKQAVALNPSLYIMATPWSPPAWMKNNNTMYGSPTSGGSNTLKSGMARPYGSYFAKFVQAYAKAGIHIAAVTPQNEPLNDGTLPSLYLPASEAASLIATGIGPALRAAGLNTTVWAYDHNWDRPDYPQTVLDDPAARPFVGATAWHCYGGSPSAMGAFHDKYPDVPIEMTECSDGAWRSNAFAEMTNLIIDSTNNWSRSVVFWALALDPVGGPMNNGCNNCVALVKVDPGTRSIAYELDYYVMGHASKFVRPGAKRIGSSMAGSGVRSVAFRNADGTLAALLYNTAQAATTVLVRGGATPAAVTIPAGALATVQLPGAAP